MCICTHTHVYICSHYNYYITCHTFIDSTTEGGPTKAELLDLLQNCEVRGASRMSSAVSSRAPSPSPSLMSIIYPDIKPIVGRDSIPSTPQLGQRTLHTSHSANLFQPIPSSNSSQSIGVTENSVPQSTLVTVAAKQPLDSPPIAVPEENVSESEEKVEAGVVLSSRSSPMHSPPAHQDLSVHQRSRSNEIDYVLSYDPKVSAFNTLPDPTSFRPLSVNSTPLPPVTATPPVNTSTERVRLGSAGSAWLKDESISNFFGQSETIEQYLNSEEPLLKVNTVTDC